MEKQNMENVLRFQLKHLFEKWYCLDLETGKETFIENNTRIISLALSDDGKTVAGGTEQGQIFVWNRSNTTIARKIFDEKGNSIHSITFNHAGNFLAAGDQQGNIRIWETTNYKLETTLEGHLPEFMN